MTQQEKKLDKAIEMLLQMGQGNFSARAEVDEDDDLFNTVLTGLNMLGEELEYYKLMLAAKSALLEDTLYNIGEVVYAIHIHGDDLESILFEFVSPRVKDLLGYTENDIYKKPGLWISSVHLRDVVILKKAMSRLLAGEEVICEYRIRKKDSKTYTWVEDRMVPKKQSDNITQIFCSARDVTSRKQVQDEREKLIKELNDKYNELMQFNYIVSHNLRAPAASILGAVGLLHMPMAEGEKEQVHNLIIQSAQTLDTLLKDLNVILSTKSRLNEKFEKMNLSKIVKDICELLDTQIKAAHARIDINIAPEADKIKSIKSYIQSSLYNLISNAIKYRQKGTDPVVTINISKKEDTVLMQVSDNGIGIDMVKHGADIFGLYKRFDTHYEGKGLGLHMTKLQVEALGGSIRMKSEPGKGTTFTISVKQ